ncbi:acyl-CoA synthetase (AMP-forming)/AMP-acid ligase II [Streptomyces sp. DSM 41037]|nr:AMP-binding protein [Streptomyces sp. DSM 41037]MDQ0297553.1 acyl-CoA synthetase (AMP-forming)/AMP-acid ligase II [Streptomyces sp. DSM 41037]
MYAVDELKDVPALPAAFETAAAAAADRTALECGKRVLTYRELNAAANRLARRLRSSEGVTAGSRVAIHMSRSVELYVALLAVLKLGGVVVPLNPAHPVAVRRSAAEEAQPVLTLRDVPAGLGSVTAERDVHELVAASASLPDGNLAEAVDPESTAFNPLHLGIHRPPQGRAHPPPGHRPGGRPQRARRGAARRLLPPDLPLLLRRLHHRDLAEPAARGEAGRPRRRSCPRSPSWPG